jgi:hypothetical protein
MQDTAHQGGPLEDPLEQAPPRSRMRASLGWALSRSRECASLEKTLPRSRVCSLLEQAPPCSRVRSALERGPPRSRAPPHACACSRTLAFNALTPAGRRHHAPGARAPVPPHQLPRRDPIPATLGGTVRRGRRQSRDAAPPAPVWLTCRAHKGGRLHPRLAFL